MSAERGISATMTPAAAPTFDMDSDGQDARSGIWRFGAPEYYALAAMVSIAIATYIFVTGDARQVEVFVEPCPGWATHVEMLQLAAWATAGRVTIKAMAANRDKRLTFRHLCLEFAPIY